MSEPQHLTGEQALRLGFEDNKAWKASRECCCTHDPHACGTLYAYPGQFCYFCQVARPNCRAVLVKIRERAGRLPGARQAETEALLLAWWEEDERELTIRSRRAGDYRQGPGV